MNNRPLYRSQVSYYLKNCGDLGECYPILLDLHNSSDDTKPHSIIVKGQMNQNFDLFILVQF